MSGSPEEVNKVLDIVNRTEYMRGYDARNEELKNDPARLNIELNHSYYKTGYLQGVADTKKRIYKAIAEIRQIALEDPQVMVDYALTQAVKIVQKYMEGKE